MAVHLVENGDENYRAAKRLWINKFLHRLTHCRSGLYEVVVIMTNYTDTEEAHLQRSPTRETFVRLFVVIDRCTDL